MCMESTASAANSLLNCVGLLLTAKIRKKAK